MEGATEKDLPRFDTEISPPSAGYKHCICTKGLFLQLPQRPNSTRQATDPMQIPHSQDPAMRVLPFARVPEWPKKTHLGASAPRPRESTHSRSAEKFAPHSPTKLGKTAAMQLVERLMKEGAVKEAKLSEIRRAREEAIVAEAVRLANTRHAGKRLTQATHSSRPVSRQSPTAPNPRKFTVQEALASGTRLMASSGKEIQTDRQIIREKGSKERVENAVKRLYPTTRLPLLAVDTGLIGINHVRAQSAPRIKDKAHVLAAGKVPEAPQQASDSSDARRLSTTAKESRDSPMRPNYELASMDSPNLSSISNHCEDESLTRFTVLNDAHRKDINLQNQGDARQKQMGLTLGATVAVPITAYNFVRGISDYRGSVLK